MFTTARPDVSARSVKSGNWAASDAEATNINKNTRERIAYFMKKTSVASRKPQASTVPDLRTTAIREK
jgi:hypothetical protein